MRNEKITINDVKNVKVNGMRKQRITNVDVKIGGNYHDTGTGVAPVREAIEKGLFKVFGN